ncbi:sulfatase-like hydrolase/transferase [Microbacterium sp. XT11]|uniref:sulfatase-like hydrolase/transferase n=1 Tax=Microbacterium sp. XT11 TaxID=367477 RepID=UPI00082D3B28|nr:sulfatase-like hydrolase/transferase [Microbacterium sp. XT11]
MAALAVLTVVVTLLGGGAVTPMQAQAASAPRNVVMIMADDLSWDLVPYMSELQRLMADGVSFDNYYVTNSLCCVSRSSILTGRFPHNTGVYQNSGPMGGIEAFRRGLMQSGETRDNEQFTYAVQAQDRGYYTMLEGKYLNGYNNAFGVGDVVRRPAGWTMWRPYNNGAYGEMNFAIGIPGKKAIKNTTYGTDTQINRARSFIPNMAKLGKSFHATFVPFSTHAGDLKNPEVRSFPAAPRDLPKTAANPAGEFPGGDCGKQPDGVQRSCYDIRIESLPGNGKMDCAKDFYELPYAKPDGKDDACELQQYLHDRIRMAQSLDELIGAVRSELEKNGLWDSTYLVFTSDNGFHLGQGVDLGLIENGGDPYKIGKGSPYETDLRVPLVVAGADAAKGMVRTELTQSVDLLPTFSAMQPSISGVQTTFADNDGMDLLPLIRGEQVSNWRQWAYSVHTKVSDPSTAGPDSEPGTLVQEGFFSLRANGELYVQHVTGADRGTISRYSVEGPSAGRLNSPLPWEELPAAKKEQIQAQFARFAACGGGETSAQSCQSAARVPAL